MKYLLAALLALLASCAPPMPDEEDADDGGAYTVSAERTFPLSLQAQGLGLQQVGGGTVTIQIRNYNPRLIGPRSRAAVRIRWTSEQPFTSDLNLWLIDSEGTSIIAGETGLNVSVVKPPNSRARVRTFFSGYHHKPQGIMCMRAQLSAIAFDESVCEASAQNVPRDQLKAAGNFELGSDSVRVEMRQRADGQLRGIMRVSAGSAWPETTGNLLGIKQQEWPNYNRLTRPRIAFTGAGTKEFATGYSEVSAARGTARWCATMRLDVRGQPLEGTVCEGETAPDPGPPAPPEPEPPAPEPSYTHYRIEAWNTTSAIGTIEIELREQLGGPSVAVDAGGLATATTITGANRFDSNRPPAEAFDGVLSANNGVLTTALNSSSTSPWIVTYVFPSPRTVRQYAVSSYPTTTNTAARSFHHWRLAASNDGANWTTLDAQEGFTSWTLGQQRSFTLVDLQ